MLISAYTSVLCWVLVLLPITTAEYNIYLTRDEVRRTLGVKGSPLYYVREGVLNTYALQYRVPVAPRTDALHITWHATAPVKFMYSMTVMSRESEQRSGVRKTHSGYIKDGRSYRGRPFTPKTAVMLPPSLTVPLQGILPDTRTTFQLSLICTGIDNGQFDVDFNINVTRADRREETRVVIIKRRKICKKAKTSEEKNKSTTPGMFNTGSTVVGVVGVTDKVVTTSYPPQLTHKHDQRTYSTINTDSDMDSTSRQNVDTGYKISQMKNKLLNIVRKQHTMKSTVSIDNGMLNIPDLEVTEPYNTIPREPGWSVLPLLCGSIGGVAFVVLVMVFASRCRRKRIKQLSLTDHSMHVNGSEKSCNSLSTSPMESSGTGSSFPSTTSSDLFSTTTYPSSYHLHVSPPILRFPPPPPTCDVPASHQRLECPQFSLTRVKRTVSEEDIHRPHVLTDIYTTHHDNEQTEGLLRNKPQPVNLHSLDTNSSSTHLGNINHHSRVSNLSKFVSRFLRFPSVQSPQSDPNDRPTQHQILAPSMQVNSSSPNAMGTSNIQYHRCKCSQLHSYQGQNARKTLPVQSRITKGITLQNGENYNNIYKSVIYEVPPRPSNKTIVSQYNQVRFTSNHNYNCNSIVPKNSHVPTRSNPNNIPPQSDSEIYCEPDLYSTTKTYPLIL